MKITEITERDLVRIVARVSPWLAPAPSAYFVGRSAIAHLAVPWPIALIMALIIETLGLATIHTALWLEDWNITRRKTDPPAPTRLSYALGGVYLFATIGLTVALEIAPVLAVIAPALFPLLAVVGGVNLVLIAQQEQRTLAVQEERATQRAARQARQAPVTPRDNAQHGNIETINEKKRRTREENLDALLSIYRDTPDIGPSEAGRRLEVHRNTVHRYTEYLLTAGRLERNGEGIKVL